MSCNPSTKYLSLCKPNLYSFGRNQLGNNKRCKWLIPFSAMEKFCLDLCENYIWKNWCYKQASEVICLDYFTDMKKFNQGWLKDSWLSNYHVISDSYSREIIWDMTTYTEKRFFHKNKHHIIDFITFVNCIMPCWPL